MTKNYFHTTLDRLQATLKAYLDDISNLLLNQNQNLRNSQPGSEVRNVARERTLTAFRRLNAERNQIITQFLQDAKLIQGENAPISFSWADMHGANLSGAWLNYADLRGAWLSYINLSGAWLQGTHQSKASLIGTDLSGAHLEQADLSGADLSEANLDGATGINVEELEKQAKSLKGATMPNGSKHP